MRIAVLFVYVSGCPPLVSLFSFPAWAGQQMHQLLQGQLEDLQAELETAKTVKDSQVAKLRALLSEQTEACLVGIF